MLGSMYKIVLGVFLVLLLASCSQNNRVDLESKLIQDAQGKVQFQIALPKYLPENCSLFSAGVQGPPFGSNTTWLSIGYYDSLQGYNIHIFEAAEYKELKPIYLSYNYLDFSSIRVLEQEVKFASSTNPSPPKTFLYTWNNKGIYFEVEIEGYSEIERHKVIGSLIE